MSLDGTSNTFIPYTINGINPIAGSINTTNFVKYSGNTSNTDLNGFDLTTAGTISAQQFAIPDNNSNDESWITYTVSTMGNLSTVGGIITTDLTNGRSMYFTGGVLGAPNFQFATLGNDNKVVCTNAYGVMSTTINAGQLDYITALTSQAGGVGQNNTWTGTNDFQTLTNVAALRITSSVVNADYTLSVNSSDQLEFTNLSNGSIFKTNGADLFVSANVNCATLGATNVEAGSNIYLAKGSVAEWRTTLGMSDEYEIQDDAGVMRLRLSKTAGLTISTMNITNVPSLTPSVALGLNGGGQVVSFAVPSATNILPLDNTFTGLNAFNNNVSLGVSTVVVNQQSITTSILQTAGISSQALGGTAVISGSYLLTPTPITFAYASVYSPTQTFLANAKYNYLFTGFTSPFFGVSLTVYQANIANTGNIAISSTVPVIVGTFSGIFTPNSNPSYLGQVYFTFSGINNKTVGWTTFTYQRGMETVNGELTVNGNTILGTTTTGTTTTGTTSTGNLTVRAGNTLTKVGGNSGANFFRLQGEDAGSSPYTEYHFNNLRRMYVGNATASDAIIASENNAQLTFATQGTNRMFIDTAGNVDVSSRELRISQLNSVCQIRMKSGNTNIASMFHCNANGLYLLATNTGDWTGSYNGLRPFYVDLVGGGCFMSEGLNVNGGSISCANQPFCIVGGVPGASVFYPVGAVWGAGSQLVAYTSAGMSNSGTSGWSSGAGAFFFTKTGRWQVNWSFYWNNFAGGSRGTLLHFNSAGALLETRYCALWGAGIGSDTTQAYSTLIYGSAGDFLQCQFQSGSGTLYFGGITHTHVCFHFVA